VVGENTRFPHLKIVDKQPIISDAAAGDSIKFRSTAGMPANGCDVIAIGYPELANFEQTISTGKFAGQGYDNWHKSNGQKPPIEYFFKMHVGPGQSGGPIINDKGEVVGVAIRRGYDEKKKYEETIGARASAISSLLYECKRLGRL